MQIFKNYILEKVYEISDKEEKDIDKLTQDYKKLLFKDSKTKIEILKVTPQMYFDDKLDENGRLKLGEIKIKDLETDKNKKITVLINFTKEGTNRGEFLDDTEEIILYYYPLGFSLDRINDIITHEVLHAKQHYKKMSKKYKKAIKKRKLPSGDTTFRSNRDYYMDPLEFPVYTTLIIKQFYKEYKASDKNTKQRLKGFLIDFIESGAKPTTDNRAPDAIIDKYEFFKFIFLNRKKSKYSKSYRSLIKKLYWLYSKLK